MSVELSTWRPLWEFSAILIVLGTAGCLSHRDRMSWWQSQGLIVLGVILGFAAIGAMHPRVDLFSLGVWIPVVLAVEMAIVATSCAAERRPQNSGDESATSTIDNPCSSIVIQSRQFPNAIED